MFDNPDLFLGIVGKGW